MRFLQNINWNRSMKTAFLMPPIILPWKPESTVYFVPWRGNEATQKADLMRHSYWYVVCYDAKIRIHVAILGFPFAKTSGTTLVCMHIFVNQYLSQNVFNLQESGSSVQGKSIWCFLYVFVTKGRSKLYYYFNELTFNRHLLILPTWLHVFNLCLSLLAYFVFVDFILYARKSALVS